MTYKKTWTTDDAAPAVLYAKVDSSSDAAFPIISSTSGSLVMVQQEAIMQQFYDYGTRTDGQPVYMGFAAMGTPTNSGLWLLYKITYITINGNDYFQSRQIAYDTWSNKDSATYA